MTAPPLFGTTAVVAGASRGIGLAIAEELMAAGAHVVRLARSLADAAAERRTDLRCDVTREADVERAARRVVEARGDPDILVQNAGSFLVKDVTATSVAEFEAQLAANVLGPFVVLRAFLPGMLARRRGLVITIGSVADHVAYPGNVAYAAGKFGLRGMCEVLARELEGTGLRSTLVSPGPVNTDLWAPVDPDARPGFLPRSGMLRPEDVAEAVLFAATRPERVRIAELHIVPRT